jgi:hypothetical protein
MDALALRDKRIILAFILFAVIVSLTISLLFLGTVGHIHLLPAAHQMGAFFGNG